MADKLAMEGGPRAVTKILAVRAREGLSSQGQDEQSSNDCCYVVSHDLPCKN